jgi:hypothetical protein
MSQIKAVTATLVVLAAALTCNALVVDSASAEGWHVNGTELTGSETAALAATSVNDRSLIINVPDIPLKIICKGSTVGLSHLIQAPNKLSAASLTYSECSVLEPTTCTLSSPTITTNPVKAVVTKSGGDIVQVSVMAATGNKIAEFTLEGASCPISGKKTITGSIVERMVDGQIEAEIQKIEGLGSLEQGSDSLQIANDPAYIEGGEALLKLESGSKWSFS